MYTSKKYCDVYLSYYWPLFKADVKRFIPVETVVIFSSEFFSLKQGIISEYVMVFFSFAWAYLTVMSANRDLQNEKSLPTVGFEHGTYYLRSYRIVLLFDLLWRWLTVKSY